MNLKCVLGSHTWNGCNCEKCGTTRDEQHDWTNNCEKCRKCGKSKENQHDWDGCKCTKCGIKRDDQHDWIDNCEKCRKCGISRGKKHDWEGCKCTICGIKRDEQHHWEGCTCTKCGIENHDWSLMKCENLSGNNNSEMQVWEVPICRVCNKPIELKGCNSEATNRILPWLGKVKNHFHQTGINFMGSFGGYCDSCSSAIKIENSYIIGSRARCENCMNKVLYNCDWSYYMNHVDQWLGHLPQELEKEASQIAKENAALKNI